MIGENWMLDYPISTILPLVHRINLRITKDQPVVLIPTDFLWN